MNFGALRVINDDLVKPNTGFELHPHKDKEIDFKVGEGRQAYLLQIEGSSEINDILLNDRDALEIVEEDILIKAKNTSHVLVIEMKKE